MSSMLYILIDLGTRPVLISFYVLPNESFAAPLPDYGVRLSARQDVL
jgi:hypothetical protein